MDFKNKNLLNRFNPAKVTDESLMLTVLAFLPAAFAAKTIESTLLYLLLTLIFLILTTLVSKLLNLMFEEKAFIINSFSFVIIAIFIMILARSFFIEFANEFDRTVTLMSIGALPYMLRKDNENRSLNKSMLNTLQSFLGFSAVMLLIGIVREVIGTGVIRFGVYTSISFKIDLFSNYSLAILANPLGSFLVLGVVLAILQGREINGDEK